MPMAALILIVDSRALKCPVLLKMELQTPSGLEIPLCMAALEGSAVLQHLSLEAEGWDQLCRGAQTEATPTAAAPCPPPQGMRYRRWQLWLQSYSRTCFLP